MYRELIRKLYEQKEEDIEALVNYLIKTFYNINTDKFKVNIDDKIKSLAETEEDAKDIKDLLDKKITELKGKKKSSETLSNKVNELPSETKNIGEKIVKTLQNYGINMEFTGANIGPSVTQYKFRFLDNRFKISELEKLKNEIAMSIPTGAVNIARVGSNSDEIGIQVPNIERTTVNLQDVESRTSENGVDMALGKDMNGSPVSTNIKDLQHVLIGGATGSGKSAGVNTMICSIIDNYSPEEAKLVLIDPKQVEMSAYEGDPHLLIPVVKGSDAAIEVLDDMVDLMEERYTKFDQNRVKNIEGYNAKVKKYNAETGSNKPLMPYIIIVIDELADLMITAGKQVENDIRRLTAKSRAAGMHLIVATQRPSVDVVTGTIKANLPSRIAFSTSSGTDSKTILDKPGAENLTGKGDMLFKPSGTDTPVRLQGAYVSDDEVEDIVNKSKEKYGSKETQATQKSTQDATQEDNNYDKAVQLLKKNKKISSSDIQLALRVPYSEAQRILQKMKDNKLLK